MYIFISFAALNDDSGFKGEWWESHLWLVISTVGRYIVLSLTLKNGL